MRETDNKAKGKEDEEENLDANRLERRLQPRLLRSRSRARIPEPPLLEPVDDAAVARERVEQDAVAALGETRLEHIGEVAVEEGVNQAEGGGEGEEGLRKRGKKAG